MLGGLSRWSRCLFVGWKSLYYTLRFIALKFQPLYKTQLHFRSSQIELRTGIKCRNPIHFWTQLVENILHAILDLMLVKF